MSRKSKKKKPLNPERPLEALRQTSGFTPEQDLALQRSLPDLVRRRGVDGVDTPSTTTSPPSA